MDSVCYSLLCFIEEKENLKVIWFGWAYRIGSEIGDFWVGELRELGRIGARRVLTLGWVRFSPESSF